MTMYCGKEVETCVDGGTRPMQTTEFSKDVVTHNIDIKTSLRISTEINATTATTEIPIRWRQRDFKLTHAKGLRKDNAVYIVDEQLNVSECYDPASLWNLSIHEKARWIDSTVYILDTEHSNCFWKEVVYDCVFDADSSDVVHFRTPFNTASKLLVNNVNYAMKTEWKLMVRGVVTILESVLELRKIHDINDPLIFVYPCPIGGEVSDPELDSYGFMDYRSSGTGASDYEVASGGKTYFYPEYLWGMGDFREEDQAEAVQYFYDTYGSVANVKGKEIRNVAIPFVRGGSDPRGSIVTDMYGNTLVSVTVHEGTSAKHFNFLYDKDGKIVDVPGVIPGGSLRLYPIGLV